MVRQMILMKERVPIGTVGKYTFVCIFCSGPWKFMAVGLGALLLQFISRLVEVCREV